MNPLISTVLLDPPSTLMFGSALALVSGKLIQKNPEAALKRTVAISAVWSAWYALCVGWFFFERADWMFVYLLDTQQVPLVPAFLVFLAVCVAYGVFAALGTGMLMQQKRTAFAVLSVVGAVASWAFIFKIGFTQYTHVGTYAQSLKGQVPELLADATMKMAMNISTVGIVAGILLALFVQFRKAGAA